MPVSTLADAQSIARDVASILDAIASATDADADRALNRGHRNDAITLRQRVEELSRQSDRLRNI